MAPCIFEDNFDLLVVLNRLGSRTDFLKELAKSKIWFALGREENFWGPFNRRFYCIFTYAYVHFCCMYQNKCSRLVPNLSEHLLSQLYYLDHTAVLLPLPRCKMNKYRKYVSKSAFKFFY